MTIEEVRNLYAYNSWANRRVLEACAALPPAQFTQDLHSSFPSVRDTLSHIMLAEWLWLERWNGRSAGFPSSDFRDFSSIRTHWNKVEADLNAFIEELSTEDLDRVVDYRNTKGHPFSSIMWQMLQHVVNHGTYHRGQVVAMLRQLGATPVATDLIAFYRERSGQPHN